MHIRLKLIATAVFAITGMFWLVAGVIGEGSPLLIFPGIVSLITVVVLATGFLKEYRKVLVPSVGIYNFVLAAYQALAAINLLQTGLVAFASAALAGYLASAVLSAFIVLVSYSNASALLLSEPEPSEESKTKLS